jgi:type IV secretory pathway VirB2 component (pilin)
LIRENASEPINTTLDSKHASQLRSISSRFSIQKRVSFQAESTAGKGEQRPMKYATRVPGHFAARLFRRKPCAAGSRPRTAVTFAALWALLLAAPLRAQQDPWEQAVQVLQTAFTGSIAKGLSLVAIVVGGLMFAFGEGQSKKALAGIVFGVGMAIGAVNFMAWLFP